MDLSVLDAVGGVKTVAGVVAAILVLLLVTRLMKPKVTGPKATARTCGSCGWQGSTISFKAKCPRCGNSV